MRWTYTGHILVLLMKSWRKGAGPRSKRERERHQINNYWCYFFLFFYFDRKLISCLPRFGIGSHLILICLGEMGRQAWRCSESGAAGAEMTQFPSTRWLCWFHHTRSLWSQTITRDYLQELHTPCDDQILKLMASLSLHFHFCFTLATYTHMPFPLTLSEVSKGTFKPQVGCCSQRSFKCNHIICWS